MPTASPKKLTAQLNEYRLENDCAWWELSLRIDKVQPVGTRPLKPDALRCIVRRGTANERNLRKIERFLESVQAEAGGARA